MFFSKKSNRQIYNLFRFKKRFSEKVFNIPHNCSVLKLSELKREITTFEVYNAIPDVVFSGLVNIFCSQAYKSREPSNCPAYDEMVFAFFIFNSFPGREYINQSKFISN